MTYSHGLSVDRLLARLISRSTGMSVDRLRGRVVDRSIGRSLDRSVGLKFRVTPAERGVKNTSLGTRWPKMNPIGYKMASQESNFESHKNNYNGTHPPSPHIPSDTFQSPFYLFLSLPISSYLFLSFFPFLSPFFASNPCNGLTLSPSYPLKSLQWLDGHVG